MIALNNSVVVFSVTDQKKNGREFDFDSDAMTFNQREGAMSFQRAMPMILLGNKKIDNRIQKFYSDRQ